MKAGRTLMSALVALGLLTGRSGESQPATQAYKGGPGTPHTPGIEIDDKIQAYFLFDIGLCQYFAYFRGEIDGEVDSKFVPVEFLNTHLEYRSFPMLVDGRPIEEYPESSSIPMTLVPVFRPNGDGMLEPYQLYNGNYIQIPEGTQIIVATNGTIFSITTPIVDSQGIAHVLASVPGLYPIDTARSYRVFTFVGDSWFNAGWTTGEELLNKYEEVPWFSDEHDIVVNGAPDPDPLMGGRDLRVGSGLTDPRD